MSCRIVIHRKNAAPILGIGLTQAEIAMLAAGATLTFELLQGLESLEPGEVPEGLFLIPGQNHEELMETLAQFVPDRPAPEQSGESDGT